jgi:hypothetical protein
VIYHHPSLPSVPTVIYFTPDKMPVSFDESVTNENLAPEDDGNTKRKFHARPTPHPKKKLRSIDEDSDTSPLGDTSSRTVLFGGMAPGDSEEEAIEKEKVKRNK